jgi:hypothetical protein
MMISSYYDTGWPHDHSKRTFSRRTLTTLLIWLTTLLPKILGGSGALLSGKWSNSNGPRCKTSSRRIANDEQFGFVFICHEDKQRKRARAEGGPRWTHNRHLILSRSPEYDPPCMCFRMADIAPIKNNTRFRNVPQTLPSHILQAHAHACSLLHIRAVCLESVVYQDIQVKSPSCSVNEYTVVYLPYVCRLRR